MNSTIKIGRVQVPLYGSYRDDPSDYMRRYQLANKDRLAVYRAAYFQANKHRIVKRWDLEKRREWAAENREHLRESFRIWAGKNKEKIKANRQRIDKSKKRAWQKRWRDNNPENYAEAVKNAKLKKPELYRIHQVLGAQRRRARVRSLPVERISIPQIISIYGGLCHLCGHAVEARHRSLDHLIPVVRGGGFLVWNMALAHRRCNQRRNSRQILFPESMEAAMKYVQQFAQNEALHSN